MESSAIRAYEIFKELNLPPETAKEIAEIMTASRDEHLEKWVASKEDLASVKLELKEDMFRMENSLRGEIASVRTELKEDIASAKLSMILWLISIAIAITGVLSGIIIAVAKGVLR